MEKPAQPDTFPFTVLADAIHPVVPVSRAHQRKPVYADAQAAIQSAGAMLEQ